MFLQTGFPPYWSTHKKLIWMKAASGGSLPWQTFVGNPLQFNAPKAHTLKSATVEFSPIQDLHGYDSPWPAGGGKNICPDKAYQSTSTAIYIGQDNGTDFPFALTGGTQYTLSAVLPRACVVYIREENDQSGQNMGGIGSSLTFTPSATGNYRIALTAAIGISTSEISKVQLELGSTATSWTPYSNECPISGWTAIDVVRAGENILDTNKIARYTLEGTEYSAMYFDKAGTYCFKAFGSASAQYLYVRVQYASGSFVASQTVIANQSKASRTITITEGQKLWFYNAYASRGVANTREAVEAWQITCCLNDYATEYTAPNGSTTTLTFPTTVYGGTAEVAEDGSCKVTSDGNETVLDEDSGWVEYASGKYYVDHVTTDAKEVAKGKGYISNMYLFSGNGQTNSATVTVDKRFYGTAQHGRIWVYDSDYPTLDSFKALLSVTPLQIRYPVASPVVTELTPVDPPPTAVQGINTMWTDGDSLTVEARGEAVNNA